MKSLKIIVILIFGFIIMLNSCEFGNKLTGEYYLTDEMKDALPYQGGEKVFYQLQDGSQTMLEARERYNKVEDIPEGMNTNEYYILEREYMWIDNDSISIYYRLYGTYYHLPLFMIDFTYKNVNLFKYALPLKKNSSEHLDSLYVIDRWIKDIYIQKDSYHIEGQPTGQTIIYYSEQYGIVKLERPDGLIMELERIEW